MSIIDNKEIPVRLLRPVDQPLGLYLRPGRNDHNVLVQMLEAGGEDLSGFVFDPCLEQRHRELRETAVEHKLEAVLDPRSVDLATEGGIGRSGIDSLPWSLGDEAPHTPSRLRAERNPFAERIAARVIEAGYTAVLAPTHYVADSHDEWCLVDGALTVALRDALDSAGAPAVPIYYPLVISGSALRSWPERRRFKEQLAALPIDAIWLRVHAFGTTSSGPRALRGYVEAGRDLHALGIPLVAERVGSVGLALMAFGAVGGIESGITLGERFNVQDLRKKPQEGKGGFSPQARVYIAELGTFLTTKQAREFFEIRGMKARFGCKDSDCCRRGVLDMTGNPRPHFLRRRPREVTEMSRLPEDLRASVYLDEFLRPATDLALTASRAYPQLEKARTRLEGWRTTLGAIHRDRPAETFAISPRGQRLARRSA
jgi:hypothetical protein